MKINTLSELNAYLLLTIPNKELHVRTSIVQGIDTKNPNKFKGVIEIGYLGLKERMSESHALFTDSYDTEKECENVLLQLANLLFNIKISD